MAKSHYKGTINKAINRWICIRRLKFKESVMTMIRKCQAANVNQRRVEKDVPSVGAKIEVVMTRSKNGSHNLLKNVR